MGHIMTRPFDRRLADGVPRSASQAAPSRPAVRAAKNRSGSRSWRESRTPKRSCDRSKLCRSPNGSVGILVHAVIVPPDAENSRETTGDAPWACAGQRGTAISLDITATIATLRRPQRSPPSACDVFATRRLLWKVLKPYATLLLTASVATCRPTTRIDANRWRVSEWLAA